MNSKLVIDSVVHQAMVLIAQLSTVDGQRSPLSHLADEVFLNLVRELEGQGLGKKVVADMFGLALRSYRQKIQRLSESVTDRGVTLWGAVHSYISDEGPASRVDVLDHFRHDDEATVRGILNDLVESGLVCRSGRGRDTTYRVATAEELEELGNSADANSDATNEAFVWVQVHRGGPVSEESLIGTLPLPEAVVRAALGRLTADGRVVASTRSGKLWYSADRCLIPVGEAAGWEAALIDHHRAVLTALAAKVVSGQHTSAAQDEVGGTTLSYDVWPGHPMEAEVRGLLATTRGRVIDLWERVEAYNRSNSQEPTDTVTFYCGQYVVTEEDEP